MTKPTPAHIVADSYGDFDVNPLAALLAIELDGELVADHCPSKWYARIKIGDDVVGISRNRGLRIEVSIAAGNLTDKARGNISLVKTETATLDATRSIEALAKDIRRRVVDPSQEALRLNRERAAAFLALVDATANRKAELERDFPGIKAEQGSAGTSLRIGNARGGHWFDGTAYTDGGMSFDRIHALPEDKARRILAILMEGKRDDA